MEDHNLVSVVIPTWDRARLVKQAIASVVAQTHANWELIVVDDGSTDDTIASLDRLSLASLRIIRSPHLGHIGKLRNLGARAARGAFIAFLDSDDLWRPQKLEKQVAALTDDGAGWSYTEYGLFNENGVKIPLRSGQAPAISGDILGALLKQETGVCPCTLVVRRPLLESIGGFSEDPRLAFRDDVDIALRLARTSPAIAIPERLTLVREHEGRLTKTLQIPYEHSAAAYEIFLGYETRPEPRRLAHARWADCLRKAGAQRLRAGEYARAAALFCRSFVGFRR